MDPQEIIRYWITSARNDWKVARHLFDKRDYAYSLFFAHLYSEKLLKALVVQHTRSHAPYGHGLRILAEKAGLKLSPEHILLLERVTEYNIRGRYDDWRFEFKKRCTKRFCEKELHEIERFGKWLRRMILL